MSALVIDTSSWIELLATGLTPGVAEALRGGRVHVTPIVAAELLSGRMTDRDRRELEDGLAGLPLCGTTLDHWFRVGVLRGQLRAKGLSVSTPDAHVAQCALDLDAELLTLDGVFQGVARHVPLRLAAGSKP